MKTIASLIYLCAMFSSAGLAHAQKADGSEPNSPAGDWRGMSVCQVKPRSCHNEDSLYHVRPLGTKAREFELQAEKIIDGRPVTMRTGPCHLNPSEKLVCAIPGGASLQFQVRGDQMSGVMKMADGTVWRKLTLKRVRHK